MKKQSISMAMLALVLIMSSTFISCGNGSNDSATGGDVFLVDISEETDWDYMAFGKDGSSVFFNVNKAGVTPTTMYYKPKKNSDDGFTFFLKDNGLPDKMIHNNHIICFENYSNYKFDVAVIYPNNTIEYHYGIETDINFNAYRAISMSGRARGVFDFFGAVITHTIGLGSCALFPFFPSAIVGCGTYLAKEFVAPLLSGNSETVVNAFIDVMGCVTSVYFFEGYTACVTGLGKTAYMLTSETIKLVNQKSSQVNQATNTLNSYTVTYNANGGSGTAPGMQIITPGSGSSITLPSGSGLSRIGYTFAGWNTKADGTGTTYNAGSSYKPTSSIVFYAKWNTAAPFIVTYDINGGNGTVPETRTVSLGHNIIIPSGRGLSRSGYTFVCWNTKADGTGTNHYADDFFWPRADITFYAKWNVSAVVSVPVTNISGVPTTGTARTPLTLSGTVEPSNATNKTIVWSVKNARTTGASISANNLNTTSAGTVVVAATIANGKAQGRPYTQDFTININAAAPAFVPVTNISGVPSGGTVGTPIALTGTVEPSNATNKTIVWTVKSAGTTGASISANNLNTTAAGTATVTAIIADGAAQGTAYTKDFSVTINAAASAFVSVTNISGVPTTGTAGTPLTLSGTVSPSNATNQTIVWTVKSAGSTGAAISGSALSTTTAGTVTVTATIANGTAQGTPYTQDFTITINAAGGGGNNDTPSLYFYPINNNTAYSVMQGTAISGAVVIPATYNGLPVTAIHKLGFSYCTNLTSVTIPSSVTTIGDYAFAGCESLPSITIPASVTSIGEGAFQLCTSLTNVTISAGVTTIGQQAFIYCSSLTSITIPSSVTFIGGGAFYLCTSLTSVTISAGVTTIGVGAFGSCTSLTSVTIPSSVTTIGQQAFSDCTSLRDVTIPASVTSIGLNAFEGCTSLASVTISAGVTTIGDSMFVGCANLTSISIPSSVTSISGGAFAYCTSLNSITIPSSVTSIGGFAFRDWTSSQTINVQGHASQAAADAAWGTAWRRECDAVINYQG